jgi:hypothetical protein
VHIFCTAGVEAPLSAASEETVGCQRAIFDRYNITSDDDLREAVKLTTGHLAAQRSERKVLAMRQNRSN